MDTYVGPAEHVTVACLGPEDVLAVRGTGQQSELVRYEGGDAMVLGQGGGFVGARPAAVTEGFVVACPP